MQKLAEEQDQEEEGVYSGVVELALEGVKVGLEEEEKKLIFEKVEAEEEEEEKIEGAGGGEESSFQASGSRSTGALPRPALFYNHLFQVERGQSVQKRK